MNWQIFKFSNFQILLIAAALALTAALYFAPKKTISTAAPAASRLPEFDLLLNDAKASLKREEVEIVAPLEARLKTEPGNFLLLDSLGKRWDALQMPAIAAHYYELMAENKPDEKSWINAAYRYFDAYKISGDSTVRAMMVQKAISSYEKVLKFNPENLDAKTDLGVCYAEGTNEPMRGIMLLREVVTKNPQHENAQFNLGLLSMKSGQYDKAAERFEKVLAINPQRKELYLMAGRAYMMAGKNDKARESFEKLKKESSDPALAEQATNYINQIHD
jgi:tetratricopeptide (TPR) repeat protein